MKDFLRLFWAVTLPEHVKERLEAIQQEFRKLQLDVKWTSTPNFHITVRFLGNTPASLVKPMIAAVEPRLAELAPFKLSLRGVGVFPTIKRPRVLWVGVKGSELLLTAQQLVEEVAVTLGFAPEKKAFSPHVTLGRFRSIRNSAPLEKKIKELLDVKVGEAMVTGLALVVSRLTPAGPEYETWTRVPFEAKNQAILNFGEVPN